MSGLIAPEQRTVTSWRSAWRCRPGGFAAVAPLSGSMVVAAVGRAAVGAGGDAEVVRAGMRALMEDLALVVGHDPTARARSSIRARIPARTTSASPP